MRLIMIKNIKKYILFVFIILSVLIISVMIYSKKFCLTTNEGIEYFLKYTDPSLLEYDIENKAEINGTKIVLLKFNTNLNYAVFKKGLNNKYKFVYSSSSITKDNCKCFIEKIEDDTFLITVGYNNDNKKIISIELNTPSNVITENFYIGEDKYFIKYKKIDKDSYSIKNFKLSN